MGEWVSALTQHLEKKLGDRFEKNRPVSREDLNALKNVIITVPASEAAKLVGPGDLAERLQAVKYAPLLTATVFVAKKDLARQPRGLGVLMPRNEGRKCLGILYNSSAFLNRVTDDSTTSLTVMLGGGSDGDILKKPDSEIRDIIKNELFEIFGLRNDPLEVAIHRWERAVPTYNRHLLDTWTVAEKSWCAIAGHVLFGNYTGQVSLRGMLELASQLGK
ncbi:unnamed protein product [Sphagnum jensenii]|uniref:Amine oxidase domain-containing protein n=1 Tax=Sphagnum jensenii TaxID=128206 RepID=A0ABP0V609_9BRYO